MKPLFFTFFQIFFGGFLFGQNKPVDVAQLTLKIGANQTEELYYGFAEGDQIIFSFEEAKGKDLKEIEIYELPGSLKFSDFKSSEIANNKIQVHQNSVYKFRFYNSSLAKRVCKISIKRIPNSKELTSFNTGWRWKTLYDTTYIPFEVDSLIGYDTTFYEDKVKELVDVKKVDQFVINKNEQVKDRSIINPRNSYSYVPFTLPKNKVEPYKEERTIAWAYWIGVGNEAEKAYSRNVREVGNLASDLVSKFVSPLAGFAVGAVSKLFLPTSGDNVHYYLMTSQHHAENFINGYQYSYFDSGNGTAGYGKNTHKLHGTYFVGLHNDNTVYDINVNIRIVVVREIKTYEDKVYTRSKVTPKYIRLKKQRYEIEERKIRVCAE